jgi:hypothetical protein
LALQWKSERNRPFQGRRISPFYLSLSERAVPCLFGETKGDPNAGFESITKVTEKIYEFSSDFGDCA